MYGKPSSVEKMTFPGVSTCPQKTRPLQASGRGKTLAAQTRPAEKYRAVDMAQQQVDCLRPVRPA
jgi:hypothetical protein